jgi:hypothetical protein
MRLAVGPLQMDGDHAMQIALHTDVLVDVTVAVDKFAGSGGLLDGHMAAVQRGKVTAMMVGAIGFILLWQLLDKNRAPYHCACGRDFVYLLSRLRYS